MESTRERKRSHQEDTPSDRIPIRKRVKRVAENQQQYVEAGSNRKLPSDLTPLASRTSITTNIPKPSKRQVKRAAVIAETGDIGSNGKAKGLIRTHEGILQYFLRSSVEWIPAIYHNDIREDLIAESEALGEYDYPRAKGFGKNDVTSFHPLQETWGPDRQNWPEVLFHIYPEKYTQPASSQPKPWYRHGKILLDQDNNPVNDFADIPATLSSELEGQYMEAMCRTNSHIKQADLRARMPSMMVTKVGKRAIPLFTLNTISMRMSRFREQAALMPREKRAGTEALEANLRKLLPEQCFKENSTKSFGRLLTPKEIEEVKSTNKGKFGYRAHTGKEPVSTSDTGASSRRRTRVAVEDNDDEQYSEPTVTTSKIPRVRQSCYAQSQVTDWPLCNDPKLDTLAAWIPDGQDHYPKIYTSLLYRNDPDDSHQARYRYEYLINPSEEFLLPRSEEYDHETPVVSSTVLSEDVSSPHVQLNDDGSAVAEHISPLSSDVIKKEFALQNWYGDKSRLEVGAGRHYKTYPAPLRESKPQIQYGDKFDVYNLHIRDPAGIAAIPVCSADNTQVKSNCNETSCGDWSFYDEATCVARGSPNQSTNTALEWLSHNYSTYHDEPVERLDAAEEALENTLLFGPSRAATLDLEHEALVPDPQPTFSFMDYFDSENGDREGVIYSGL